jgi:3,5-epimerase/4-reductase
MKEKGFVFGAGYFGTKIANKFGYELIDRQRVSPLELKQLGVFLDLEKPEIIINAIGKTGKPNVDWCEQNKELTIQANVNVAANLCTEASKRGIYFVQLGSGCIYDGDNNGNGFSEEDPPNFYGPQFYAKSKILAERVLSEFPSLILRIRMPIDGKPHERNLIDKLSKFKKVIDIPNSMTTIPHFLDAMWTLIDKKRTGIYNIVNPGTISAARIMEMYKELVDPNHTFEIFSKEELDRITMGIRSNCVLNSDKLESEGIKMPQIQKAIRECLLEYKKYRQ